MGGISTRSAELSMVGDLLARLDEGRGGALLIRGPAGIGKTTLVRAAVSGIDGVDVLVGRAYRFQSPVPFGPIIEALAPRLRSASDSAQLVENLSSLGVLFDGLAVEPVGPQTEPLQRSKLLHALHTLVHRMSGVRPVVIAIDDAQWADESTIEFLALLSDSLSDVPVVLLLVERVSDPDAGTAASTLFNRMRRDGSRVLDVGPLDVPGVEAMVSELLGGGAVEPELVRLLHDRTAGTPLYVKEVANRLVDSGHIERRGLVWQFTGTSIPPSSHGPELMAGRLEGCEHDDLEILELLALHGAPLAESDLIALGANTSRLGPLARRRLIVEDVGLGSPRWALDHPVLADVIVDHLITSDRQARHERLARLFVGSDPDRFAHHLMHSGPRAARVTGSDDDTAIVLRQAGERALARRELSDATDLLTAAGRQLQRPRPDPAAAGINLALARAWSARGHHRTASLLAADACTEFAELGDFDSALDAVEVRADGRFLESEDDWAWLEELAEQIESQGTDAQRFAIRFRCYFERARAGFPAALIHTLQERIAEMRTADDPTVAQLSVLCVELFARSGSRDIDVTEANYDKLCELAERNTMVGSRGWNGRLDVCHTKGAWSQSEEVEREYLAWVEANELSTSWRLDLLRWDRLIARGDLTAALQTDFDHRYVAASNSRVAILRALQRVRTFAASGDMDAIESEVVPQPEVLPDGSPDRSSLQYYRTALLLKAAHRNDRDAIAATQRPLLATHPGVPLAAIEANALADIVVGDSDGLIAAVDLLRTFDRDAQYLPGAKADLFEGEFALRYGDSRLGAELIRRAHLWFSKAEMPIDAARTALLLEPVSPVSDEQATALLDWLRSLELDHWARKVADLLRRRGVSRNGSTTGESGRFDLSRREREVAKLVMEGMTNREVADALFISVRTVTSHLDHIYTKLGVSSRRDLAPLLRSEV